MNSNERINVLLNCIMFQVDKHNKAVQEHEEKLQHMKSEIMTISKQLLSITLLLQELAKIHVHN